MAGGAIKVSVSTQIRNLYSDQCSCLNIRFYNSTLSLSWYPYTGKDNNGHSQYDSRHGQQTTISYESAYGLYQMGLDIISGKINECSYPIQCLGATLVLDRKLMATGPETTLTITKNNVTIPFKFPVSEYTTTENGQQVKHLLETGLGAFVKTVEGFLTGINADRHLDKLTEEFAKAQDEKNGRNRQPQPMPNQMPQPQGYQQPNAFPPPQNPYNQRRSYNNNYNRQQPNQWGPPQSMSSYQLPPS